MPSVAEEPSFSEADLESFVTWLCELERGTDRLVVSRMYRTAKLYCYMRSSRLCAGTLGSLSVCFADILMSEPGRGALTAIVARLHSDRRLAAKYLYFENVSNERLAGWLQRQGFQRAARGGRVTPSWYRLRADGEPASL